jgi:hypothetical protein
MDRLRLTVIACSSLRPELETLATEAAASARREASAVKTADMRKWKFERLPGDLGWLRRLPDAEWNDEEFLTLRPGERVVSRFDELLIGAEPA